MATENNPANNKNFKAENNKEEKAEFIKREDILTMEKDIKQLRGIEVEKEREKIISLKTAEEKKKVEKITPEKKEPETLVPKFRYKPSVLKKILIRTGVILFIFFILGFISWQVFWRKPPIVLPPEPPPPTEIPVPVSLIPVEKTIVFKVSKKEEISGYLSEVMKEELPTESFAQIAIKNTAENNFLDLKQFFEALEIQVPGNFYQYIESSSTNFTLFAYAQEEGIRIGFINKIKETTGLAEVLRSWEPTMETDFGNFFQIMGKTGTALVPYFENASHLGLPFRYQTFSVPHFGICYLVSDGDLVFTSSGKSMLKIIEKLNK